MLIRKTVLITLIFIFLITSFAPAAWAGPQVVGQAAVLIDSRSGKILYTKNENSPMAPASTTKILTAIIALEKSKLTDTVKAGKDATVVEPSAIGLKEGETMTMENLLYSLMLKSANDAAVAIAEHISGSVEKFADLMNSTVKSWGGTNSHFTNPNGLPDSNHYTTAHDLAIIAQHAMQNHEFRQIVSTKVKTIPRADDKAVKWLQNHNRLLWRYDGANGVKTGYTVEARQCLVASAERGGQEFIAVILGSEGNNIWSDAQTLLDYGFDNYVTYKQKDANTVFRSMAVKNGTEDVTLVTEKSFYYTVPKGQKSNVTEQARLDENVPAPIKKGQVLGKLKFIAGGKEIGYVNLVAQNDISVRSFVPESAANSVNPLLVGALLLGGFVAWNLRKRKRKKRKVWYNRAIR